MPKKPAAAFTMDDYAQLVTRTSAAAQRCIRRGHWRILSSLQFTHKRGQAIYVEALYASAVPKKRKKYIKAGVIHSI